jgi:hypothetical protein
MAKNLERHERENLRGHPKNAHEALKRFKNLCKKQNETPVLLASGAFGLVYGLKEKPSFRATFFLGKVNHG